MTLTRLDLFNKLAADGMLQQLSDRGIISKKMHEYFKYYREVQACMLKSTLNNAVNKAAEKLNVSERTIWRAVKTIRK